MKEHGDRGISFNVLNGTGNDDGTEDPIRFSLVKKIIKHRKPVFAGMQELNRWEEGKAADFANYTGLNNFVLAEVESGFHVGLFTKRRILHHDVITDGFCHGAIRAVLLGPTGPYEVWVAHMDPLSEDNRLTEAETLAQARGPVLIDGNHISPFDKYHEPSLHEALDDDHNERYRRKNERGEKEFRFEVANYFKNRGFVDMAAHYGTNQNTFPALLGTERFQYPIRLDYILAPQHLAHTIHGVHVLKNFMTSFASDHFPIEFEFDEAALAHHSSITVPVHDFALAA